MAAIRRVAEQRRRWGYRRIVVKLRREGWSDNHKRIGRIYREECLQVRRRKRKRNQPGRPGAAGNGHAGLPWVWAMDFVSDTAGGRTVRLTTVDGYSRESPVIETRIRPSAEPGYTGCWIGWPKSEGCRNRS